MWVKYAETTTVVELQDLLDLSSYAAVAAVVEAQYGGIALVGHNKPDVPSILRSSNGKCTVMRLVLQVE